MSQLWPVIAIAVIVGAAVHIVRSFFNQFAQNVDLSADDPYVPKPDQVAGARNRALERATDGDYRDAVRYLIWQPCFIWTSKACHYDRTRTNREYVRSVRTNPAVAADLQAVVHVFDETWYGYHPLSASAYTAYAARINASSMVSVCRLWRALIMRRPTRDTLVAVVLLFVGCCRHHCGNPASRTTTCAAVGEVSSQPNGAKALRLWLEDPQGW